MEPIPVFPQKRPIELSDKPFFDRCVKKIPPEVSELTFTNIFAWPQVYQFELFMLDEFLLCIAE